MHRMLQSALRRAWMAVGRVVCGLVVCCAGGSIAALAADAAPPSPGKAASRQFGAGKPKGRLDRNALRVCLKDQDRIKRLTDDYAVDAKAADGRKAEIDQLEKSLHEQGGTLDRTKAEDVEAFNAHVKQRDQLIDDYNAAVPALNNKAETLQVERGGWSQACGDRTYDELDYFAIQREGTK